MPDTSTGNEDDVVDMRAKTIVVGGGHMGLAIVLGLMHQSVDSRVEIVEVSAERRKVLRGIEGLVTTSELRIGPGDLVVLAIPPQAFAGFVDQDGFKFASNTAVLSVMAGVEARAIADSLGTSEVVRAIPNTPAEVFQGVSVYFAGAAVAPSTVKRCDELLGAIGRAVRTEHEGRIDDATALCGGGPAFVGYFVDAFCGFAEECGFDRDEAIAMTLQIFHGTASLIEHSGKPPMQIAYEVMTPGGTTEQGIASFDRSSLRQSIQEGLRASANRSRELSTLAARS